MGSKPIVRATTAWINRERHTSIPESASVSPVDLGIGAAIRTGIGHHVLEAVEIAVDGETRLVARWMCGGASADVMPVKTNEVDCINCRLAASVPQSPVVYYAWAEGDELLYVGSSTNVAQRLRQHATQADWWSSVRRLSFDEFKTEAEARRAEIEAIQECPGRHNKQVLRIQPGAQHIDLLRLVDGAQ